MAITSHGRKALIICGVLAILSQLSILPALCDNNKLFGMVCKQHFTSDFYGSVILGEGPLFISPRLAKFHLITKGTVVKGDFLGDTVVIDENILLHLESGNGLSQGSFTVLTSKGNIYVSFTAIVHDFIYFKGHFQIVGGTEKYKKANGYGILGGGALGPYGLGTAVYGSVDGYIWLDR